MILHCVAFACMALLLWQYLIPLPGRTPVVAVNAQGSLTPSLAALVRSPADTVRVTLSGAPTARARATLRALRGSGRRVTLQAASALSGLAVATEHEWRLAGGTRVQVADNGASRVALSDNAGELDSLTAMNGGAQVKLGPVQGVLRAGVASLHAAVAPLSARRADSVRVLVTGNATWESRFIVTALEEAGWTVDVALTLAPSVVVRQGESRVPSRARHGVVVVLPGASAAAVAALPAFVRRGGGVVIVGDAARDARLAVLRVGSPAAQVRGEVGAEASADPRHGLDLVPLASLTDDAVPLELRDGRVAVAARRVGAGRVLQVGYENSWLWRMAGNDDAAAAHRRWWTVLLSGVVPQTVDFGASSVLPEHDTLDAAPVAALARDFGRPQIGTMASAAPQTHFLASVDQRLLFGLALLSFVASWTLRRLRGLV
jgi:hypothetical protein